MIFFLIYWDKFTNYNFEDKSFTFNGFKSLINFWIVLKWRLFLSPKRLSITLSVVVMCAPTDCKCSIETCRSTKLLLDVPSTKIWTYKIYMLCKLAWDINFRLNLGTSQQKRRRTVLRAGHAQFKICCNEFKSVKMQT